MNGRGETAKEVRTDAVEWSWRTFDQLTVPELYQITALREAIFIVEQDSPYLDADGHDQAADHLLGVRDGELVAYLRTLPVGVAAPDAVSFGRVVVKREARGAGLGRDLVAHALRHLDGGQRRLPVRIAAQLYLQPFYESVGFTAVSRPYVEDRIWHIAMVRQADDSRQTTVHEQNA